MSGEGLSRRRARAGDGSSSNNEGQGPATASTSTSPSIASGPSFKDAQSSSSGAGNANAGTTPKHKVAFDPRDLDERSEEATMPVLTLMEEILLLGLKDKQGYLSFWNDNISYTLRGCIVIELALRHRIAVVKDPNRRRFPLADRYIEVVDDRMTGEVLLDEALKMMKVSERMSIGSWVDLMSGETWNVMKIGYQLKQVRERLAKGLVDKGVLRTEKKNFLLFDMATHPVSDPTWKDDVLRRVLNLLAARTAAVPLSSLYQNPHHAAQNGGQPSEVRYKIIRAVCMVCSAFAANVLENALVHLNYDQRELAFNKCDELLQEFSQWPFGASSQPMSNGNSSGSGGSQAKVVVGQRSSSANSDATALANLAEISRMAKVEVANGQELHLEVVAGVISILSRMDSLL